MLRTLLLSILLAFIVSKSSAQLHGTFTGYLEYKDSTGVAHINGEIMIKSLYDDVIYFKKYGENRHLSYPITNILGFGFDDRLFKVIIVNGQPEIFEVFVRNNVSLLYDLRNEEYVIYKDSSLTYLSAQTFKRSIIELSPEKKNIDAVVSKTHYRRKSLSRTVLFINNERNYYPELRFGLIGGFTAQGSGLGYSIGGFVDFPLELFSTSVLHVGFNYQENSYPEITGIVNISSISKRMTSFNIPIAIKRYMQITNNKRAYSLFGLSYNRLQSKYGNFTAFREIPLKSFVGLFVGIGYEKETASNNYFGFNCKFRFLTSFDHLEEYEAKVALTPNIQISTHYTF